MSSDMDFVARIFSTFIVLSIFFLLSSCFPLLPLSSDQQRNDQQWSNQQGKSQEDLDVASSDAKSKWDQAGGSIFRFTYDAGEGAAGSTAAATVSLETSTRLPVEEIASASSSTTTSPTRRRRRKSRRRVEKIKSLTYIDNITGSSTSTTSPTTSTTTTTTASPSGNDRQRIQQRRNQRKNHYQQQAQHDELSSFLMADDKAYSTYPYLQEMSSPSSTAASTNSLFEPFLHTSGYILPPPFMTSPMMQMIPAMIPPTHPIYLISLPKPPISAPFDPLLLSPTILSAHIDDDDTTNITKAKYFK